MKARPVRSILEANYDHQPRLIKEGTEKLLKHNAIFMHLATGSGKTRVAIEISNNVSKDEPLNLVFLAHTQDIVFNNAKTLVQKENPLLTDDEAEKLALKYKTKNETMYNIPCKNGGYYISTTWQGLCAKLKAGKQLNIKPNVLIIDEIHIGAKGVDATSIVKVREALKAKYEIYLSATPKGVNSNLLLRPYNNDTVVSFSVIEAVASGAINPTILKFLFTGREATVFARNNHNFSIIKAGDLTPVEQAKDLQDSNIRLSRPHDWDTFWRARVKYGLKGFFQKEGPFMHEDWQALFFVPGIKDANSEIDEIRKQFEEAWKENVGTEVNGLDVMIIHSGDNLKEDGINKIASERIELFKKGKFKIAVVVNMLQVGSDIPSLETVLDLDFTDNPEKALQKIGRIVRRSSKTPKTKESRYYPVVDALSPISLNDSPDFNIENILTENNDKEIAKKVRNRFVQNIVDFCRANEVENKNELINNKEIESDRLSSIAQNGAFLIDDPLIIEEVEGYMEGPVVSTADLDDRSAERMRDMDSMYEVFLNQKKNEIEEHFKVGNNFSPLVVPRPVEARENQPSNFMDLEYEDYWKSLLQREDHKPIRTGVRIRRKVTVQSLLDEASSSFDSLNNCEMTLGIPRFTLKDRQVGDKVRSKTTGIEYTILALGQVIDKLEGSTNLNKHQNNKKIDHSPKSLTVRCTSTNRTNFYVSRNRCQIELDLTSSAMQKLLYGVPVQSRTQKEYILVK